MANSFYWVDSAANTRTIYVAGTTTAQLVLEESEHGEGRIGKAYVEKTPSRMANQYRAWIYDQRIYGFTIALNAASAAALETAKTQWSDWHDAELGEGHIKRITVGGLTRCLDCIPLALGGKGWQDDGPSYSEAVQEYEAANPWWRSESASTANSTFNNAVPVNISCANTGEIDSWPEIVITGVINTPVLTNSDGDSITVNKTTANADDTLTINCRPNGTYRRYAYYQVHGAGTRIACQVSSGSKWITLPTGTNNLAIVATSGTATIVVSWYLYYRSLY